MFEIVNPRQVIIVTTRGEATVMGKKIQRDNAMTLTWHSPVSGEPEMYMIALSKKRFTYTLIKESKVFAVNFINHNNKEDALFFGTVTGAVIDKFTKSKMLTKEDCDEIDCCRIKEAVGFLECELVDEFDTGDHVLLVGRVLKKQENYDAKRLFYRGENSFTSTI